MTVSGGAVWSLARPIRPTPGFVHGLHTPCLQVAVHVAPLGDDVRQSAGCTLLAGLALHPEELPELSENEAIPQAGRGIDWLLAWMDRLNGLARLPIIERSRVVAEEGPITFFVIPSIERALLPLAALLNRTLGLLSGRFADDDAVRSAIAREFGTLSRANNPHSNGPRLIRAALERGIPVQDLPGHVMQFGLGSRSHIMQGGFTARTTTVGTRIARQKAATSQLLQRMRLPVAPQRQVRDFEGALKAAHELGWPVVVKPAALDGGEGVRADLRSEAELRTAFAKAKAVSDTIIIEKHVEGLDYRIVVHEGYLLRSVVRSPPVLTGDGRRTIAELLAELNADPRRSTNDTHYALKHVDLDEDAMELLAREGLTPGSVPEPGRVVRLRRTANVATGAEAFQVTPHPDNVALAVRAAEALRLDLAGIDILCPDITRSWREVGAAICEVNASPELGGQMLEAYGELIERLTAGNGRIPVVAVVGGLRASEIARVLAAAASRLGLVVGLHDDRGLSVGGDVIDTRPMGSIFAGRALAANARVDVIVLGAIDAQVAETGFGVPEIDMLVLSGENTAQSLAAVPDRPEVAMEVLLRCLTPAAKALFLADPEQHMDRSVSDALDRSRFAITPVSRTELVSHLSAVCRETFALGESE